MVSNHTFKPTLSKLLPNLPTILVATKKAKQNKPAELQYYSLNRRFFLQISL